MKQLEEKRNAGVQKQNQLKTDAALSPTQREQLARDIKTLEREMQDLNDEVKQKLAKQDFDVMKQMYQEVQDAVSAYAKAYAIELVLEYNDGVGADQFSPPYFQRKLATVACMPMYMDPRMDITNVVTGMLNKRLLSMTPATRPQGN
jgi:Skp family chaperone for outer membrane proteins